MKRRVFLDTNVFIYAFESLFGSYSPRLAALEDDFVKLIPRPLAAG